MAERTKPLEALLRVGMAVLLNPGGEGSKARIRTFVRGWQKSNDIILDRPGLIDSEWHDGDPCIVRFVCEGYAVGFSTIILEWRAKGSSRWCRVAWPETHEVVTFRKHERIEISAPCAITLENGKTHEAELVDLSIGGCGLRLSTRLLEGTEFTLRAVLSDGTELDNVLVWVCSARAASEGDFLIGCSFSQENEHVQSDIAFYMTLQRGKQETPNLRVLIVDAHDEHAAALCHLFRENHYDAFIAKSEIEGFHRACVLHPAAIVINHEQRDLAGVEIVRILRASEQFEKTALFLYGGDESLTQGMQQANGVTHVPAPFSASVLYEQVAGHLPHSDTPMPSENA